jgi:excinuclease ABC subunit A
VAVVAGCAAGTEERSHPHGLTIASLTVVSDALGLIGFMVRSASSSWTAIAADPAFCVNVLSEDQGALAQSFATDRPDVRFDKLDWEPSGNGCPRIEGAFGLIECELESTYQMGDHQLVLAKVAAVEIDRDRGPLLQAGFGTGGGNYGWKRSVRDGARS